MRTAKVRRPLDARRGRDRRRATGDGRRRGRLRDGAGRAGGCAAGRRGAGCNLEDTTTPPAAFAIPGTGWLAAVREHEPAGRGSRVVLYSIHPDLDPAPHYIATNSPAPRTPPPPPHVCLTMKHTDEQPPAAGNGRKCHDPPPNDPPATAALDRDRRAPGQPGWSGPEPGRGRRRRRLYHRRRSHGWRSNRTWRGPSRPWCWCTAPGPTAAAGTRWWPACNARATPSSPSPPRCARSPTTARIWPPS